MTQSKAKGLKYWCDKLSHTELPVLATTMHSVKSIPRTENIPYSRLVKSAEIDPALCWHVIRAANRRNTNPNTDIESLQLAISMIGQTRFWESVDKAPILKPQPKSRFQLSYIQELSFSLFAAFLARDWATRHQVGSPDALYWDTLLARSPIWALWFIAYPEMLKWQQETRGNHHDPKKIEIDIFGCTLEDICYGVAKLWKLPQASYESWHKSNLPSHRDLVSLSHDHFQSIVESKVSLRLLIQQPHFFSFLAHWATLECRWNWYNHRLNRCLQVVSHCLHTPTPLITAEMHQAAVAVSHFFHVPGLAAPAVHLLWTNPKDVWPLPPVFEPIFTMAPDEDPAPKKKSAQPTKPKSNASKAIDTSSSVRKPIDQVILNKTLDNLTLNADSLSDVHHVFKLCMTAVCSGIHFDRGFACLLNPHQKTVRICYSEGFASTDPIRKLSIPLSQAPLITHLLRHPSSMHIEPHMIAKVSEKLPAEMMAKLGSNDFVLMSVFAGARPIGVVYADRIKSTNPHAIQPEDYEAFKKLCHAVCVGLDQVAKNQRRRRQNA